MEPRNQRPKVFDAVAEALNGNDGDADSPHVLLELDTRVVRDEDFKSGVDCRSEQDTVTKAEPSLRTYCRGVVAEELCC